MSVVPRSTGLRLVLPVVLGTLLNAVNSSMIAVAWAWAWAWATRSFATPTPPCRPPSAAPGPCCAGCATQVPSLRGRKPDAVRASACSSDIVQCGLHGWWPVC